LVLLAAACSHAPPGTGRGPAAGIEEIVVVGTNDLHGQLRPARMRSKDAHPVEYGVGGVTMLASYIQALRERYPNRVLWLDGGDQFQGTLDSDFSGGETMIGALNLAGPDAVALGNHEFDFGLPNLNARMKQARFPYLGANVLDRKTGELASFDGRLREAVIRDVAGLRIAVVGLATPSTANTTLPSLVKHLRFEPVADAFRRIVLKLREQQQDADIRLAVGHIALSCTGEEQCKAEAGNENNEAVQLAALPQDVRPHAVVAGHTHRVVAVTVNGVPMVQAGRQGKALNVIHLFYDRGLGRVVKTTIDPPVEICEQHFEDQGDCDGERKPPGGTRAKLVPPTYLGKKLHPVAEIADLVEKGTAQVEKEKKKVVGFIEREVKPNPEGESEIGNLVSDSFRFVSKADFAFVNQFSLRAKLPPGEFTFEALYQALPFPNRLVTMRVSGRELWALMRVAESGARGMFAFSGLRAVVSGAPDAPVDDLNGDGKREAWETRRLLALAAADGTPIDAKDDEVRYTVTTTDFIATGGDLMGWAFDQVNRAPGTAASTDAQKAERVVEQKPVIMREALQAWMRWLAQNGRKINAPEDPLVDPKRLRLIRKN
jgi:5'-nucleotidase / UDP-sugar diphosphatase